MLINARNFPRKGLSLCYAGCSCHNTKQARRQVKHSAKKKEEAQWKKWNI